MWIEERNGTYRMYERYKDPVTNKVHKVSVRITKDSPQQRSKGKAKLDEIIAKRSAFIYDLSFKELTEFYLASKSRETKLSTQRRNEHECNTLRKILGNVKVEDLTAGYVKAKIMKNSKKPSTVNEHIQRFKEIIRWGYQNDFVEDASYLDKLLKVKDKSKHQKVMDKFLEKEECSKILEDMAENHYLLTKFMILSGVRVGEALALTENDLDFENREISITKTKDPVTSTITPPKTHSSVRQIYMQDDLLELCREIVEYAQSLKHKSTRKKYLFWNQYQEPMEYRAYNKYLENHAKEKINRKVTPHYLRHTHASLLAENDMSFEMIQRRLGHENSRITKEIYVHVTNRQKQKDNEAIKELKIM